MEAATPFYQHTGGSSSSCAGILIEPIFCVGFELRAPACRKAATRDSLPTSQTCSAPATAVGRRGTNQILFGSDPQGRPRGSG